jgi:hypothetical protein
MRKHYERELMFGIFRREEPSKYDAVIDAVISKLETYGTEDAEFADALDYLERLTKIEDAKRQKRKVSPDTMALVLGNLAGILLIVAYEQKHVMTTRAKEFMLRAK